MEPTLTFSIQDYLKAIYELTAGDGAASTTALAKRLNVSPASVTGMVQKLASQRPALLVYRKHRGVTLTRRGAASRAGGDPSPPSARDVAGAESWILVG